jgi:hypothetical protein
MLALIRGELSFENYSQTQIKLTADDDGFVTEFFFDKKTTTMVVSPSNMEGEYIYINSLTNSYQFYFIYSQVVLPVTTYMEEFINIFNGWWYGGISVSLNSGTPLDPLRTLNFIEGTNITITESYNSVNNTIDVTINSTGGGGGGVTAVTATGLLTSSGGTTPDISSQVNKAKLVGRNSVTAGIMEEITVGGGLTLSGTTLSATTQVVGYEMNFLLMGG